MDVILAETKCLCETCGKVVESMYLATATSNILLQNQSVLVFTIQCKNSINVVCGGRDIPDRDVQDSTTPQVRYLSVVGSLTHHIEPYRLIYTAIFVFEYAKAALNSSNASSNDLCSMSICPIA